MQVGLQLCTSWHICGSPRGYRLRQCEQKYLPYFPITIRSNVAWRLDIPRTFDNVRPSGYYVCGTQTTILQIALHPSNKDVQRRSDMDCEAKRLPPLPYDGASETRSPAMWVTKFGLAQYRQKNMLHRFNQTNALEIPLPDISNTDVHSLVHHSVHMVQTTPGKHSPLQQPATEARY